MFSVVAEWEGLRLRAYRDPRHPTICFGETRGVHMGMTATKEQCEAMLLRSLHEFHAGVIACTPSLAEAPEKRVVAAVSLAYNIGLGGYCSSTVARLFRTGNVRGACNAFLMWVKVRKRSLRGLVRRRQAERALCLEEPAPAPDTPIS